MFVVTFDSENKVHKKEFKRKGFYPRDGFYRGSDGNFYKKLDDPRCISRLEKIAAIKKAEEDRIKAEQEALKPKPIVTTISPLDIAVPRIKVLRIATPLSFNLFVSSLSWKQRITLGATEEVVAYTTVGVRVKVGLQDVDDTDKFHRIEINTRINCIKFWLKQSTKDAKPDFVILGAFIK